MEASEAEARLQQLLNEAGFRIEAPDPRLGWEVFKRFVQEPVEKVDDGVLFEIGVYSFTGKPQCHFDFVRQFSFYCEDGEYSHMEQLRMEFLRDPNEQLQQMQTYLWAEDFSDLPAYFRAVENLPEFQAGMAHSGWRCEICQHGV